MTIWAILPVKPTHTGKSRLAGVLTDHQREILNQRLFENTLKILTEVNKIEQILVISKDSGVLAYARNHGANTIQEDSASELNGALRRATLSAKNNFVKSLLILPADLPLLRPGDLDPFLNIEGDGKTMVIAPDRRMEGTNVLFLKPVGDFEYRYGQNSFQTHLQQAAEKGYKTVVVENERLGLDLDFPEDLALLKMVSPLKHEQFLQNQETYHKQRRII